MCFGTVPARIPKVLNLRSVTFALEPETRAQRRLPPAHPPRPIQSHPARVRMPSSNRLSNSRPAIATSKVAWTWMALTGRRPAEIFFSAKFSLPKKKLPFPPSSSTANSKPARIPAWLRALPHLRPGRPKDCPGPRHSPESQKLSFPRGRQHHHWPATPKYVSTAFGSLDLPWKPGHLRSAYGAICCHMFKPKNITDDIFLAQILGPNSWGRTHLFR
jgi:hypothetical protein